MILVRLMIVLLSLVSVACPAAAAELPEAVTGICITSLDGAQVLLEGRVIRAGDVLTAEQAGRLTFAEPAEAAVTVGYLPIYEDRVDAETELTFSLRGRENQAPVAEDQALETYKNLPNSAKLKVRDPEEEAMTFTVVRQPRRGTVEMGEDGSFTYSPKKNKVGIDSFTYTATDPAGNVSREATVTITITKPADAAQYTDTAGESCRFAAEWMKNTGIFVSESVGGNRCFRPEQDVSRGEFLTMLVSLLELELDTEVSYTGFEGETPEWLKPYLAAAMRSGLVTGVPDAGNFDLNVAISGAEAAVMLQNALDLSGTAEVVAADPDMEHQWAADAVGILGEHGVVLEAQQNLTRGDAARVIYQASLLIPEAPGTAALRMAQ